MADEAIAKLLRDIWENPPDPGKLAAAEAARTDPWRWYCRICGAKGEAAGPGARDTAAMSHLGNAGCGRHPTLGRAMAGRLLHVWTY